MQLDQVAEPTERLSMVTGASWSVKDGLIETALLGVAVAAAAAAGRIADHRPQGGSAARSRSIIDTYLEAAADHGHLPEVRITG